MDDSLKFLSTIFDLLNNGRVFDRESCELKSVVEFEHPGELKVCINQQEAPIMKEK